ncbi:hypothetical protein [Streptomyces sp. 4F14]|uniref:hypothetical protein n=1 Tax=Streptomyces sp. 4F14 TaxID=3394380 RepID=UPI003A8409F3
MPEDQVTQRLLSLARQDPAITGAALTGSHATDHSDEWSDLDLVLAVHGDRTPVVTAWTARLYSDFGALHHWDLGTIRVFLLPGWTEVDITFAPEAEFGPRGPQWRTLFGSTRVQEPFGDPDPAHLIGLSWHHALHARTCVERGRAWQAEHWIGALRAHLITLACLRLGVPSAHAKGAHLVDLPLEPTLVRSLDAEELRRALGAAVGLLVAEVGHWDSGLAQRLGPALEELVAP